MNFLAHAWLSFNQTEILVGNMISDFVKGAAKFSFNGNVQKGITLHRWIDEFTDNHEATQKAKQFFRPYYRLYSGAIVDVLYDHFLANDKSEFDDVSLKEFSKKTYLLLEENTAELPNRFLQMFTYMKTEDWLYNYKYNEGVRKTLHGLIRRAAYLKESSTAYNLFLQHYTDLNNCYQEFFKDVKQFAKEKFEQLNQ